MLRAMFRARKAPVKSMPFLCFCRVDPCGPRREGSIMMGHQHDKAEGHVGNCHGQREQREEPCLVRNEQEHGAQGGQREAEQPEGRLQVLLVLPDHLGRPLLSLGTSTLHGN